MRSLRTQTPYAGLIFLFGAVHTNYDAKFTCESIKLAVIKNRWLAQRLGGDMYSVVFRYEQGTVASVNSVDCPVMQQSQRRVSWDIGHPEEE